MHDLHRTSTIDEPVERWALVLAAGEGTRLGHLTRDAQGRSTPKQFCSVSGGPTLLEEALERGMRLAGPQRVVTVVAAQHESWWRHDTSSLPLENVVVQPQNRGTAAGILLPLLAIARRAPAARVVVLPSDHYFESEAMVESAIVGAFEAVEREHEAIVLLGVSPDRPDPELGWIVPAVAGEDGISRVECFVEKPSLPIARELLYRGGLWNSFIFVSRAATLLDLYWRTLPALLERLAGSDAGTLETVYAGLDSRDFSREVLEANVRALRVAPLVACGWSDLGTPERLARCTARLEPALRERQARVAFAPAAIAPRPVLTAAV